MNGDYALIGVNNKHLRCNMTVLFDFESNVNRTCALCVNCRVVPHRSLKTWGSISSEIAPDSWKLVGAVQDCLGFS